MGKRGKAKKRRKPNNRTKKIKTKLPLELPKQPPPTTPPPPPEAPPKNPSRLSRLLTSFWFNVVTLGTLLGLIVGLIAGYHFEFVPRLSLSTSTLLDPDNPFSMQFVLLNEGNYSIYSIRYSCILNEVETTNYVKFVNSEVSSSHLLREELALLQKDTFYCPFAAFKEVNGIMLNSILRADITLSIDFKSHFNLAATRNFRFVAQMATDGKIYWFDRAK